MLLKSVREWIKQTQGKHFPHLTHPFGTPVYVCGMQSLSMFVCHCYLAAPFEYLQMKPNVSQRFVQAHISCLKLGARHTIWSPIITRFWPRQRGFFHAAESLQRPAGKRTGHLGVQRNSEKAQISAFGSSAVEMIWNTSRFEEGDRCQLRR